MPMALISVIMTGGSGTRLWPVSRRKKPKQLVPILGEPLQTQTVKRLLGFSKLGLVGSKILKYDSDKSLLGLGLTDYFYLAEPQGRDTAAAIALTCFWLKLKGQEQDVVGVFPADHLVSKTDEFKKLILNAEKLALQSKVVTLGIKPDFAATGFGYLEVDDKVQSGALPVRKFHEKPSTEKAESFLKAGNFFWNGGIFVFQVSTMLKHLETHLPRLFKSMSALKADLSNIDLIYSEIESISIDYGVMEKLTSEQLVCLPANIGWSDVGSWDAVTELADIESQNCLVQVNAKNNFVFAQNKKVYATLDVDDLIIVDTKDALLVTKKGSSQKVKNLGEALKIKFAQVLENHVDEDRPWGTFEVFQDEPHFKLKKIKVSPGQQISYQSHAQREEHWLLVKGVGEIILNDQVIPVKAGSYQKIPLGAKHRIRNTGSETIEFVEVQLGTYFGEDDIVRYQDDYQRK
jgi:mannose-1-phosphate guanylyltransferase/mannose-6-phosphate isomerase